MPKKIDTEERLGADLRRLATLHKRRMKAEARAKELKREEQDLQADLMKRCLRQDVERLDNPRASLTIRPHVYARVDDWQAVWGYVLMHGCPELLQKRINLEAFRERTEAGEEIPGVDAVEEWKASLRVKA